MLDSSTLGNVFYPQDIGADLTFQSTGLTAAYATLMTISFSCGIGVGAGPICRGFDFAEAIHAASLINGDIFCYYLVAGLNCNEGYALKCTQKVRRNEVGFKSFYIMMPHPIYERICLMSLLIFTCW
jgi:hypothetical protein